jgi:formamidopyrimidine-DNA glycosylase
VPELPEVEVGARNLRRWLAGKKIAEAKIAATRVVRGSSPRAIEKMVHGRRVESVSRRGKWIRIALDGGALLFSHFGMSGKWVRRELDEPAAKSERARLTTDKGLSIRYQDPRMFGRLIPSENGDEIDEWTTLGPDALDGKMDARRLKGAFEKARGPIKVALLDQTRIAGIGNIQATEALWRAKLHPQRLVSSLTDPEWRALWSGIQGTLKDTLAAATDEEITYLEEADAENIFDVYGRGGEPCPRCKTKISRTELGGRTTFFCKKCQPRR